MKELTDSELMQSTHEDQVLWLSWVKGLPGLEGFSGTGYDASGMPIPYACGPHNIEAFRKVVEIVKPKKILEIGFNLGYSSAMWLELSGCDHLLSYEISQKAETMASVKIMEERYKGRFTFCNTAAWPSISWVEMFRFDMIFIDGGHEVKDVEEDINFAHHMRIPWLVFDDWLPRFGPGVQIAAAKFPLEIVEVMGNTCLMKWSNS